MIEIVLSIMMSIVVPSIAWAIKEIINHGRQIESIKKEIEVRVQTARDNYDRLQKAIEEMIDALAVIREDITKIRVKLGVDK